MSHVTLTGHRHRTHRWHAAHAPAPPPARTPLQLPTREDFFTGVRQLIDTLEASTRSPEALRRPMGRGRRHRLDCSCAACHDACCECACPDSCQPDPCQCSCCVGDVDLLVNMRFGERRVVPIEIENERRREREVSLELSDFRTRGGRPAPVSGQVSPTKFTLAPCEEKQVILLIDFRQLDPQPQPAPAEGGEEAPAKPEVRLEAERDDDREPPDVDECVTAYADLRVVGCDIRPIRLGVAIRPRDCEPFTIHCGCGCC